MFLLSLEVIELCICLLLSRFKFEFQVSQTRGSHCLDLPPLETLSTFPSHTRAVDEITDVKGTLYHTQQHTSESSFPNSE